jgi:DNA end-binding protein Ku
LASFRVEIFASRRCFTKRSWAVKKLRSIRPFLPDKELNLAFLLVNSLTAQFDASKYRDGYREKLDALIAAKLENKTAEDRQARRPAPVVNILEALQRSLDSMVETSSRNPHRADKLTKKTSR